MMTQHTAREICRNNDMYFRRTEYGDFRVTCARIERSDPKLAEAMAYYTDDCEDAAVTAVLMRKRMSVKRAA